MNLDDYISCRDAELCPPFSCSASEFDPIHSELIAFGGCLSNQPISGGTFRFKGGTWTRLRPNHVPPARSFGAMVFDPALGVIVMYGGGVGIGAAGISSDTWTWDGSDWTQQNPAHDPLLSHPSAAYDYARQQVVLIGSTSASSMETWTYDGLDWTHHAQADGKPAPPRIYLPLSFDPVSKTVVTFGGMTQYASDMTAVNAVWEWDGQTWTKTPATSPDSALAGFDSFAPVFDRGFMLICLRSQPPSTWRWDGSGFTQLHPPHQPDLCDRLSPDVLRQQILLYGWQQSVASSGTSSVQYEVWSWSGDDWSRATI